MTQLQAGRQSINEQSQCKKLVMAMLLVVAAAFVSGCSAITNGSGSASSASSASSVSTNDTAVVPHQSQTTISKADAATANINLKRKNIACTLITNAEVRDIGYRGRGTEFGEEFDFGSENSPSYVKLAIGYATSQDIAHLIASAKSDGAATEEVSIVDRTAVTTLRTRPDCVGLAQRQDGAFVALSLVGPPDEADACDEAKKLTATALSRLPTSR